MINLAEAIDYLIKYGRELTYQIKRGGENK